MDAIVTRSVAIASAGPTRVMLDGVEAPLSSRKALAILVYLALQPSHSDSRERIATRLWSESSGDHARAALRQTLRRLKADLGPAGQLVEADRNVLRLTQPVHIDVLDACEAAARGEPPELLSVEEADLGRMFAELEDLDPDFDLWIAVQRERLTALLVSKLETALAVAGSEQGRLALAEALARADQTHEGAARAAMQAHVALGDPVQAMRVYERLWRILDEELDVEPSEKTQALYISIKQGQMQPAAAAPVAPAAEPEIVAPIAIVVEATPVAHLPESFRFIALTFREEMIGALSRFRDWMVIDGKRNAQSPPTYRAYDLRITLHNSAEGGIVVSMTLNDHAGGRCIWSERQVATLDGLPRLLQTSLRSLALALNVHLSTPRLQSAREVSSPMGRKYELWLLAQALTNDWRMEARVKAEGILRDLIETTPGFAPALVALAKNINVRPIIYPGTPRVPASFEESLSLSARAVAIDPLDSQAHLCRYWAYAMSDQRGAALAHLSLALDLNENDPWTIISAALGFAFAGQIERATELVNQASAFGMRHSLAAQGYIATTLYLCGDYRGSIAAAEVAGDSITNLPAWASASHMHLGETEEAARTLDTFLRLARASWVGAPDPTDRDVVAWFLACFPIQDDAVRSDLGDKLLAAIHERKRRRP